MPRPVSSPPPAAPALRTLSSQPLRIGFVPLSDCAPAVVAFEHGLFTRHGVKVQMLRQPGWASIRDGLMAGTLDAAHAPATLVFTPGEAGPHGPLRTAFLFNTQGNAITLSSALHRRGVRDNRDLVSEVRSRRGGAPLTFAAVARFSMHMVMLRQWLRAGGIDPDRDVRLVALPPRQMAACLAAGHIDGFCAGEPWNTLAVVEKTGWMAATSAGLAPDHPEKALLVTRDVAEKRSGEHAAVIRALHEAAAWCDSPAGRTALPGLLARPEWLDLPESVIAPAFQQEGFVTFHRDGVNEPSPDKAARLLASLRREKLLTGPASRDAALLTGFDHSTWLAATHSTPSATLTTP
jgi:ABC-type nitrate/sulfonate/bicarbonate transport system substrate-binding protein